MVLTLAVVSPQAAAIGFDAESLYDAIFVVYSGDSMGSGFAVGENCIVTNAHVIADTSAVCLDTYGGETYEAEVVALHAELDLAVLCVEGAAFPYLSVASGRKMRIGADVYAVGAPNHLAYTLTKGVISANRRVIAGEAYIQANIALNSGNSGGPLLADDGAVIGVNSMKLSDTEGIGFAIPIETVLDYLASLELPISAEGYVEGPVAPEPLFTGAETASAGEAERRPESGRAQGGLRWGLLAVSGGALLLGCGAAAAIYRANRSKITKLDPRDRTDFDIDIEE